VQGQLQFAIGKDRGLAEAKTGQPGGADEGKGSSMKVGFAYQDGWKFPMKTTKPLFNGPFQNKKDVSKSKC